MSGEALHAGQVTAESQQTAEIGIKDVVDGVRVMGPRSPAFAV